MSMPDEGPLGPVPDDNQPGHHPQRDQDKPDLDDFAERLGVTPESDQDAERGRAAVARSVEVAEPEPAEPGAGTPLAETTSVGAAPVGRPAGPGAWELGVAAPLAEVREAVWDFARASLRLFVVTPARVGWQVSTAFPRAARARSSR